MTSGCIDATEIPGLHHEPVFRADDARGRFVKLHSDDTGGRDTLVWDEIYYSTSGRGVIRGMHLQLPPHDHTKAVHCVAGRALDVVVDLRTQSPTLGRHAVIELDSTEPSLVVVPPGCAHGFQALDDDTLMLYLVSSVHAPAFDSGIRWDSFGCAWPLPASEISDRDRSLPDLTTFRKAEHGPWST